MARTLPPSPSTCSARIRTALGGSPFSGKIPHPSPAIDRSPPIPARGFLHAQHPEVGGHLAAVVGVVFEHEDEEFQGGPVLPTPLGGPREIGVGHSLEGPDGGGV